MDSGVIVAEDRFLNSFTSVDPALQALPQRLEAAVYHYHEHNAIDNGDNSTSGLVNKFLFFQLSIFL